MGVRRKGRILAFQSLYAYELCAESVQRAAEDQGGQSTPGVREGIDDILNFPWIDEAGRNKINQESLDFGRLIAGGTLENIAEIDDHIKVQLEHWDFSRLNKVDQAILRMSVYSLLFQPDIPASVTIDEAVDISKEFGTDESYRFINGVLDGIRKNLEP
ncbi:MAG: transcription antitermination factor NusB [Spirochaetaceae bacterium]|nr:MAG: transcription antitermination factor NusB [Spirochaetaceae bacterium]